MTDQPRTPPAGMKDVKDLLDRMTGGAGLQPLQPAPTAVPPARPATTPAPPGSGAARPATNGDAPTRPARRTQRPTAAPRAAAATPPDDRAAPRGRARSVRIDRDVARLLGVASTVWNRGYTEIALTAVEAHHQHAHTLPAGPPAGPPAAAAAGGLFPPRQPRVAVPRDLLSLYLTDAETEVLDQVAASSGLSRSELVSRSLRAHLSRELFAPAAAVLDLQSSGDGVHALKTRIDAATATSRPAPPLPDKPDGWMALPKAWGETLADVLDMAQAALRAESWTAVVAAALRDGAR
jgi:hypothetical protein